VVTTVGDGAAAILVAGGTGRVVGVFSHGFYLRGPSGIIAVGGPAIPPGPIHVTMPEDPRVPSVGEPVVLAASWIDGAGWRVELAGAWRFRPRPPPPRRMALVVECLAGLLAAHGVPDDLASVWDDAAAAIRSDDLDLARRLLQGRGTGLTPTGDDVLAGVLLLDRWAHPESGRPSLVAASADTTDLSRSYLRWAAAGQSVEPVHDMVDAAARGDGVAVQAAAARVAGIGGSSGRALLVGLRSAATATDVALIS
jgi:Protein of unknown function (DUF2877)